MITPEQALAIYRAGAEAVVKVIRDSSRQVDLQQRQIEALQKEVIELKRKIGGQPGHPRHERPLFPEADIQTFHDYHLAACPECGNAEVTFLDQPPRVIQLDAVKGMFHTIHDRDSLSAKAFEQEQARRTIMKAALDNVPSSLDDKGKEQKKKPSTWPSAFVITARPISNSSPRPASGLPTI